MPEPKLLELDGTKFIINHLPATVAPKTFKRLVALAGPVLGDVFAVLEDAGKLETLEALRSGKLQKLIEMIGGFNDDELLSLMLVLADHTQVIGQKESLKVGFDIVFTGRLNVMIAWFVAAVKHNFSGFTIASLTQSA